MTEEMWPCLVDYVIQLLVRPWLTLVFTTEKALLVGILTHAVKLYQNAAADQVFDQPKNNTTLFELHCLL